MGRFAQVNGVFSRDNVVGTHFYALSRSVVKRAARAIFCGAFFLYFTNDDVFDNRKKNSTDLFVVVVVEVVYVVVATAKI